MLSFLRQDTIPSTKIRDLLRCKFFPVSGCHQLTFSVDPDILTMVGQQSKAVNDAVVARAWGKSVLSEFAKYCTSNGVKFEDHWIPTVWGADMTNILGANVQTLAQKCLSGRLCSLEALHSAGYFSPY